MIYFRILLCFCQVTICISIAKAQCPAASPVVIHSVVTTQSRCQASGSATVSASGGATPYTYSIIAGPSTAPAQSSNIFGSLAPGTYTVQVTDNCNTSVTASVTVTGGYTVPSPAATTQPTSCPNSSDGTLTIGVTGGLGPFSYSLVSPSPVTAGPQANNVFTGLRAGNYTYQVSDSCGNFQTRTVNVAAGSTASINTGISFIYVACDSFEAELTIDVSQVKPPYNATFTLPDGRVFTTMLSASDFSSGFAEIYVPFRYHHVTGYPDPVSFTVTDNCGTSANEPLFMSIYLDMQVSQNAPGGCGSGYSYNVDLLGGFGGHCSTITYTLISPVGDTLAVQTNNSTFSGYPPGSGYKVIRQDCCERDSLTFTWAPPPSYSSVGPLLATPYSTCKENTTNEFLLVTANFTKSIVLVSGPPSVTFLDGTVHTYTYPDTLQNPVLNTNVVYVAGLTAGTYKLYDLDICGGKDSTTFTIDPSDLRHTTFTASGEVACGGGGSIVLNATTDAPTASITISPSGPTLSVTQSPYANTVTGLTPGTYDVTYHYTDPFQTLLTYVYPTGMANEGCDVITDTIVVPGYQQPLFSSIPAVANCGTTRDVALLPDSASGVQPYEFQIIAGPQTTATQSSPVFSGLSAGTYTFQMADACGNSYSSNISIDALTVPNVTTTGLNCTGGAATFTLPATPFNSYAWQHPDGTTTTGDTLAFNPITSADTGTYVITTTSTIGGCTSTSTSNLIVDFCTVLAETLLHFDGRYAAGVVQLDWQSALETNLDYYIVERSTDGITFMPLWQVAAKNGTMNSYTGMDTHPPSDVVYYRLQMVEASGVSHYSQVIVVSVDAPPAFNVHPRLITGAVPVTVDYRSAGERAFIRVVGVDGKVWFSRGILAGTTTTTLETAGLPAGAYFIVFGDNGMVVSTEVVKE